MSMTRSERIERVEDLILAIGRLLHESHMVHRWENAAYSGLLKDRFGIFVTRQPRHHLKRFELTKDGYDYCTKMSGDIKKEFHEALSELKNIVMKAAPDKKVALDILINEFEDTRNCLIVSYSYMDMYEKLIREENEKWRIFRNKRIMESARINSEYFERRKNQAGARAMGAAHAIREMARNEK